MTRTANTITLAPRLFVREAGSGPPLVLLHGIGSSSRFWSPNVPDLRDRYHVIAPDLLGFGRSPKPRGAAYSAEEHIAALVNVIEERADGPVTLVGHSMGSTAALHLAVTRPDLIANLVLISLPVLGEQVWGHDAEGMHRFHRFSVHSRPGRLLFSTGMRAVYPLWAPVAANLRPHVPPGAARDALRGGWDAYWGAVENLIYVTDVPKLFTAAPGPITLLHGTRDYLSPVEPVRVLAASRPDVRYIEIADATHNPTYSHPWSLLAALGDAPETGEAGRPLHHGLGGRMFVRSIRGAFRLRERLRRPICGPGPTSTTGDRAAAWATDGGGSAG